MPLEHFLKGFMSTVGNAYELAYLNHHTTSTDCRVACGSSQRPPFVFAPSPFVFARQLCCRGNLVPSRHCAFPFVIARHEVPWQSHPFVFAPSPSSLRGTKCRGNLMQRPPLVFVPSPFVFAPSPSVFARQLCCRGNLILPVIV
ncbi:MAG: hypothetical protein J7K94_03465, partial [Dehalococcoidia bacterium]|nr:hypothetical protein [Dehalococcoidia bacterium]